MGKKPFNADSWLNPSTGNMLYQDDKGSVLRKDVFQECPKEEKFSLGDFLVPGWTGEGLLSKSALAIKKIILTLWSDARIQFNSFKFQNKSFKNLVYNEFLSFANSEGISFHEIQGSQDFWDHLQNQNSPYRDPLEKFKKLYCFRSIVSYLYKIRFMIILSEESSLKITEDNLQNPIGFLSKIFRKGSSRELISEALRSNSFSWYRPSSELKTLVKESSDKFYRISTTEMMKVCSYEFVFDDCDFGFEVKDSNFSHTLSHKSFGLFVDHLILKFPKWLGKTDNTPSPFSNHKLGPRVVSCKYIGDYVNALSLSHWLAQENNVYNPWNEIISPDFYNSDSHETLFAKICHEFQFLSFLVQFSKAQNFDPIEIISKVMRDKNTEGGQDTNGQMKLFPSVEVKTDPLYERIILNTPNLPKNNPHHNLLGKINEQLKNTKEDGYLYVFTNQNLFVPSQSDKIEQLLRKVKVECIFNFEELEGKGEIGSFLYLFSKRPKNNKSGKLASDLISSPVSKESCLTFRFGGKLSSFHNFSNLVEELEAFIKSKSAVSTPVFRKEFGKDLFFEFHQDAIVEGKLLHSASNDPSKITHPNFFKNLTKSCLPLDQFFNLESLANEANSYKRSNLTSGLLGINFGHEENFPIILIVDYRNPNEIRIELINSDSYKAKKEQYGLAYFQYFGLTPKRLDLNINVFREFFNTDLGLQIIQLSLNGGFSKLKSKLNALLIPKFFLNTSPLPDYLEKSLSFLKVQEESLLSYHPEDIRNQFEEILPTLESIGRKYPWEIMGLLSFFKNNISCAVKSFNSMGVLDGPDSINFKNPLIKNELKNLELNNIYPKNNDLFIEILIENPSEIRLPLSHTVFKSKGESPSLTIFSDETPIIRIFSDSLLLGFVDFILSSAETVPVSDILQNLSIPNLQDLKTIVDKTTQLEEILSSVFLKSKSFISQILSSQISSFGS